MSKGMNIQDNLNKIGIGNEFDDHDIKIYTPGDFDKEDDSNMKIYPMII